MSFEPHTPVFELDQTYTNVSNGTTDHSAKIAGITIGVLVVLILAVGVIIYFCMRIYGEKLRNYCKKRKQSEQGSESGVRYETFTNPRENESENHSFMRQVSQVSENESVASVAEKQDYEDLEKETETTQTETQHEGGNTGTEHDPSKADDNSNNVAHPE